MTALLACSVTIEGDPVPKARARTFIDGQGRARSVTPARTHQAEQTIGWQVKAAWGHDVDPDGQFVVSARFYLTKHKNGNERRVDLDNLLKTVLDACNGIVWADDSQVVTLTANKYYDTEGSTHLEIIRLPR